jgi:hypothetical protein
LDVKRTAANTISTVGVNNSIAEMVHSKSNNLFIESFCRQK